MSKRVCLYLFLVICFAKTHGQQFPVYRHGYIHPYKINPAAAGTNSALMVFADYKKLWSGVEGVPRNYQISIDAPLQNPQFGLGLKVKGQQIHLVHKTGFLGTYRYQLKINKKQRLSFGFSAGFIQQSIDFGRITAEEMDDHVLLKQRQTATTFSATTGLKYTTQKYYADVVVHHLNQPTFGYYRPATQQTMHASLIRHYYLRTGYHVKAASDVFFEPSLEMYSVQGAPAHFIVNAIVNYGRAWWGGLAYDYQGDVSFTVGTYFDMPVLFAYSYSLSTGAFALAAGGGHEVTLGYVFAPKTGRQQAYRLNQDEMERLKKINQQQMESLEILKAENSRLKQAVDTNRRDIDEHAEAIGYLQTLHRNQKDTLVALIQRLKIPVEQVGKVTDTVTPSVGYYYTVLGAYHRQSDALLFQRILSDRFGMSTGIVQRPADGMRFVYSSRFKVEEGCRQQVLEELRRLQLLELDGVVQGKPWVYGGEW